MDKNSMRNKIIGGVIIGLGTIMLVTGLVTATLSRPNYQIVDKSNNEKVYKFPDGVVIKVKY